MEKEKREKISFSKLVAEIYVDIRWHEFKKKSMEFELSGSRNNS